MADAHSTVAPSAAALHIESYWWGDIYRGSREELIAAGLLSAGMFPGDEGRPKTQVTIRVPNGTLQVFRASRHRFQVHVPASTEEQNKRQELEDEGRRLCVAPLAQALVPVTSSSVAVCLTPTEYRGRMVDVVERVLGNMIRPALRGEPYSSPALAHLVLGCVTTGYRLDRQTLGKFDMALGEMLDILRAADVRIDEAAQRRERARKAREDVSFVAFMRGILPGYAEPTGGK